jgi:hypothetical protein
MKYSQKNKIKQNYKMWTKKNYFIKIFMIRGIGYRHYLTNNDLTFNTRICDLTTSKFYADLSDLNSLNKIKFLTFKFLKFLNIKAGHTVDLLQPISKHIFIKILKKERKLIIYGKLKQKVNNFAQKIYEYRRPSVYTGRGIRQKQVKYIYKIGKKDKQKGKSF